MSRWKNGSTGPERRPRGSGSVTMRFRWSRVGTSPFHSGVICLEREPRLRVPACALNAMRRSHGHRIGRAQEREPEATPRGRVPAVRGLPGDIDPSGVPEAKYSQLARNQDEEPGNGQPQLDVPEDRSVARVAVLDEASHGRVPADIGRLIERIGPPDLLAGDAQGQRGPQRDA